MAIYQVWKDSGEVMEAEDFECGHHAVEADSHKDAGEAFMLLEGGDEYEVQLYVRNDRGQFHVVAMRNVGWEARASHDITFEDLLTEVGE